MAEYSLAITAWLSAKRRNAFGQMVIWREFYSDMVGKASVFWVCSLGSFNEAASEYEIGDGCCYAGAFAFPRRN